MRTTVEITDEQRARLLEIAARRGEKGFSSLVQEAIDRYLEDESRRQRRIARAIRALGTFDEEEADALEASVAQLRERWR